MNPFILDPLLAVSGGVVGAGALRLLFRKKVGEYRGHITGLEAEVRAVRQQLAKQDEEAMHLARVRLPALIYALQHGGNLASVSGPLHPQLIETNTGRAHEAVLQQVNDLTSATAEQAEQAARSAVRAVTSSMQALVNELQAANTHLLDREHDATLLALVQPIDHAASQLARRLQILGVLVGMWPGRQRDDASLLDAVRGGVSRIRDFSRVRVPHESPYYVAGRYVEPLVLAVAELLDNAARHSAPTTPVEVSFLQAHNGVSIAIHDAGPGLRPEAREEAARRLSGQHPVRLTELRHPPSFGHLGVGALADRYGFRAMVDEEHSVHGGVRATLFVPSALLASPPAAASSAPLPAEHTASSAPLPAEHTAPVPEAPAWAPHPQEYPAQQQYPVEEKDGLSLPVRRRRFSAHEPRHSRPATETPSPDSGTALAAFIHATQSARAPEEESPS
ncbi:ATP-binding protein [Streptomyces sp. NPDC046994]|uniref:ATP-binding protein n=1 Tax=Streptomyces sp. NPDC046994 TaxID=3155735 RepID=UPI00345496FE